MARTHKLEKLLAEMPDKVHGPWWRFMVANHDTVARMLAEPRSMPDVIACIGKIIGRPPVSRASAWESWKSAQAHVARIRSTRPAPARTPPARRAKPAPITPPPAPPAAASRPPRPIHPSKILADDNPRPRYIHSSKIFD